MSAKARALRRQQFLPCWMATKFVLETSNKNVKTIWIDWSEKKQNKTLKKKKRGTRPT